MPHQLNLESSDRLFTSHIRHPAIIQAFDKVATPLNTTLLFAMASTPNQWTELVSVDEEGTRTSKRLKHELGDTPDALRTQKAGFTIRAVSIHRDSEDHTDHSKLFRGSYSFYNYLLIVPCNQAALKIQMKVGLTSNNLAQSDFTVSHVSVSSRVSSFRSGAPCNFTWITSAAARAGRL